MLNKERNYILFIKDIINSIEKIEKYIKDETSDSIKTKEMIIDAVIRNFEIIGEAINHIPEEIQKKYPDTEWREAKGFRNILIHNYFGIDIDSVWETINKNLPDFKEKIKKVFENESNSIN